MKAKNKILYLIHTPPPVHGVSNISSRIYESSFINKGFTKRLIRLNLSTKITDIRQTKIIQVLRFIRLYTNLLASLLFYRPNLVYFSIMPVGIGFWKDAILALTIKFFRVKILFHLHNRGIPTYYKKAAYRFIYKLVFKKTGIIHLSEGLVNSEVLPFFKDIADTHICSNSVPDNIYLREQKPQQTLRILFFSNLFVHKGLRTLLKSVELLHSRKMDVVLVIAGAPTQKSTIFLNEFLAAKPELKNYLEIHDKAYDQKKKDLFNNSDVFVFPSEFKEECMPLVILEALSAGLPVIATNIGAISSTVSEGENGFLIAKRAPDALVEKIEVLLKNKELRLKMGSKSRSIYLDKFEVHKQEMKMRQIFSQYINPN